MAAVCTSAVHSTSAQDGRGRPCTEGLRAAPQFNAAVARRAQRRCTRHCDHLEPRAAQLHPTCENYRNTIKQPRPVAFVERRPCALEQELAPLHFFIKERRFPLLLKKKKKKRKSEDPDTN